jgi:hypothetical protein
LSRLFAIPAQQITNNSENFVFWPHIFVAEIHEINHAIEGIFNAISELFSMPITVSVFW